jgi:hypothetical protein
MDPIEDGVRGTDSGNAQYLKALVQVVLSLHFALHSCLPEHLFTH